MTAVVNVRDLPRPLPEGVVYIGRGTRGFKKSPWANPYRIGQKMTWGAGVFAANREDVLDLFERHARRMLDEDPEWLEPLRGKVLACWCKPERCHGDVLLALLETHRPVARAGRRIEFGVHVMPGNESEFAPAWPSMSQLTRMFDRKAGMTREGKKPR